MKVTHGTPVYNLERENFVTIGPEYKPSETHPLIQFFNGRQRRLQIIFSLFGKMLAKKNSFSIALF